MEAPVKAHLAACLGLTLLASSAMAEGRVAEVFMKTCLAQFPDFKNIDMAPYQPSKSSTTTDRLSPANVPMMMPTSKTFWEVGTPGKKSPDDFLLEVSEGTVLEKPAKGCMVLGMGGGSLQEETLLATFQTSQFVGEMKSSITPGFRYWIVDGSGRKAFFGISLANAFAPAGALMFLVVIDPSVAQQLGKLPK